MFSGAATRLPTSTCSLKVPPCSGAAGPTTPRIRGHLWRPGCTMTGLREWQLATFPLFPAPVPLAAPSLLQGLPHLWLNPDSSPQEHLRINKPPGTSLGRPCLPRPSTPRTPHRGARGPYGLGHISTKGLQCTLLIPSSIEVNHGSTSRELQEAIHQQTYVWVLLLDLTPARWYEFHIISYD